MDKMFLNKYENIIIVNPELKYIGDIKEKIFNILGEFYIDSFEDMGNKKLAYKIQEAETGHYIKTEFYAKDYEIIKELERYFRINDDVLKYITIKIKEGIKDNQEYDKALYEILDEYTNENWGNEPLDGDEVDRLTEFLRAKLNLINGNITQEEYDEILV